MLISKSHRICRKRLSSTIGCANVVISLTTRMSIKMLNLKKERNVKCVVEKNLAAVTSVRERKSLNPSLWIKPQIFI